MPEVNTWQTFGVALVGGLTVKVIDIIYQEVRRWISDNRDKTTLVDNHLDPLLKSADELNGKIRSLAEKDFLPIIDIDGSKDIVKNREFVGLMFLFGKFWAQIEIIRKNGISVSLSSSEKGARLQKFFDCLESRRVRIIDRILQRSIGEILIKDRNAVSFIEFVHIIENEKDSQRWIKPLETFLSRMRHTHERQKLLQYGVVIHALIDYLDKEHLVTRERPSWPNKLTKRSWQDLKYRVFKVYLGFIRETEKYLGPPKKAAHKQRGKAVR